MKSEEVKSRLKDCIVEFLGVPKECVTPGAYFINDLGCDSLDMVELAMEWEEEFEILIPDEDAERIQTVGGAEVYLIRKLGATV